MYTIYRLNADELDSKFLESLKSAFGHKQIEIAVSESDETDYLLRASANREHLVSALADVEAGRNLVTPDQAPFRCGRSRSTPAPSAITPAGPSATPNSLSA